MKPFLAIIIATSLPAMAASVLISGVITTADSSGTLAPGDTFAGRVDYEAVPEALEDGVLYLDEPGVRLTLNLTFASLDLNEQSDPARSYPAIHLGELFGIDFLAALPSQPAGSFLQLYPDGSLLYSLDGSNEFEGAYTSSVAIPEPGPMASFLGGIVWIFLFRKRP